MITGITDGIGGEIGLTHEPHTEPGGSRAAGLKVVTRYHRGDGMGNKYEYSLAYVGMARARDRGRLGFKQVVKIDHQANLRSTTVYNRAGGRGNLALNGTIQSVLVETKNGAKWSRVRLAAYDYRTNGSDSGVSRAPLHTVTQVKYDAGRTYSHGRVYTYDEFDNPIRVDYKSQIEPNQNHSKYTTYRNDPGKGFIGLPTAAVLRDAGGKVVRRTSYQYDDRGNLTSRGVCKSGCAKAAGAAWITRRYNHDGYGNVVRVTDPLGHSREITFNANHHAFPVRITSPRPAPGARQLITSMEYFENLGALKSRRDPNGNSISYELDGLARRIAVKASGEKTALRKVRYGYVKGRFFQETMTPVDSAGKKWSSRASYMDGLARIYRVESSGHEAGRTINLLEHDGRGQIIKQSLPPLPGRNSPVDYA